MIPNPKYDMLAKRVDLFKGISPEDVHKIISRGLTMTMEKDNVIFYKGTSGNQMFVILTGKVSLYDGEKHLVDLRTGDMFGEMALINNEPRSATAVAAETSQLFILSETFFQKLMTKRIAIRMLLNIIGTMSKRLQNMNKRLLELKSKDGASS
jgi:CRP-like cAMP-binding protein